ncbi:MAG: exosome subunit [Candidatus Methanoperedens sp.]|nr:exosome subunit [Candidatus Methanoperedens sp.]
MNVHHITFRAIVAATESDDRVKTALSLFLFNNETKATLTEGHFGNPIIILEGRNRGKDIARFMEVVKSNLNITELEALKKERCERIDDECCFHIRFDKQAAFGGKVRIATTSDAIIAKIKLKVYPARRENAIIAAESLFAIKSLPSLSTSQANTYP